MPQVTKNQHFVPEFYLESFAASGSIQVLDLHSHRIAKPRPYQSVCYQKFFYAQRTGVQDELSQHLETWFTAMETQIAERFPRILEHAASKRLSNVDLDALAYMMAIQWMRTERFRNVVQRLEADIMKRITQVDATLQGFTERTRRLATEHGVEMTEQEAKRLRAFLVKGEYTLKPDNSTHLRFIASEEHIVGFHNLFLGKQWNVLTASERFRFVTSDNPVSEWIPPQSGIYGASFLERKHYFPLSPDIMIESVDPTRDDERQSPADTIEYRTLDDDDVLVSDMVVAHHANRFVYGASKSELQQLLWQSFKPGQAMERFRSRYLMRADKPPLS